MNRFSYLWLAATAGILALGAPVNSTQAAEEPYVLWAKTWPTALGSMAFGPAGDLYVVAASDERSSYNYSLSHLLHFNQDGRLVGTNTFEGVNVGGMVFDSSGNRFLTGSIETNGFFDVSQVHGFFVAKFGSADQLLWVRSQDLQDTTAHNIFQPFPIALDAQGCVYAGGHWRTLGTNTFSDQTGDRPQFCKFDSSGQLLWAKRIEFWPSGEVDEGGSMSQLSVDPAGNLIISGYFREGTADFGGIVVHPGSTGHSYNGDSFTAKYDPAGNVLWVQLGYAVWALATDQQGNIYAAFSWGMDGVDGLAKLNPNGNLLWSKTLPSGAYINSLALEPDGAPVFSGSFDLPANFDGITLRPRSAGFTDFFVAKADTQGNFQWAISGGGSRNDGAGRVVCDPRGNVYVTGYVYEMVGYFGEWPLVPVRHSDNTSWTSFVSKISPTPPLKIALSAAAAKISWPVKATNYVLEATSSLRPPSWDPVNLIPAVSTTERSVQVPSDGGSKFFRLRKP